MYSIVFVFMVSSGAACYYLLNNNHSAFKSKVATIRTLVFSDGTDALEQKPNSIYERSFLWGKTVTMINDYPIFGCGMANWKIILPSYGLGSAAYMKNDSVRFVHPHNDFLLIAAETGILGVLLFAIFLIILLKHAFYQCYHSKIREKQIQSILMIFGLFSLIIISFFGMPLSRIYPAIILMLIAAIVVDEQNRITGSEIKFSPRIPLVLFLLFALSTAGIAIFGKKRLHGEFLLSDALIAEKNRNYSNMNTYLQQINTSVLPVDVTATPVSWYQGYCWFYLGNIDAAFNAFKEAEKNNPYHLKLLNDLGTCYNIKVIRMLPKITTSKL
ncbi:MAG: O-antigen ligase family protein [Bacteroidetes bacterium]|nr:O-antigen ligase family protein [Bacteroidota bacterium]